MEPPNAKIPLRFPQGTAIERTDAVLRRIEEKLIDRDYEDVEFFLTTVGSTGAGEMAGAGAAGSHIGQIHAEFMDAEDRKGNTTELVAEIRKLVGVVPGAEVKVEKEEEGPPTGPPVSIEVSGDDFDTLAQLSERIIREIETVPGLVDLQDDLEAALPELRVEVDRQRAALLGLDTAAIGRYLRTAIFGMESSTFRFGEDEYDITVRLPEAQRNTLDLLDRLRLPVAGGHSVPLSSVCRVEYRGGRGAITRKNQKRVVTISGNNENRGVDKILEEVKPRVADIRMPRGYSVTYAGDTQEMEESGKFLGRAFAMALGLIVVILVIQFNSAVLPLIIMTSVMLSVVGVLWGLMICRLKFGVIMTGLGVISLAGIVVNNAIVLVDCIRQRREEGHGPFDAAVEAGKMRLRPVLLTATTTILGLVPMAIGYSLEIHEWPPRIIAGAESSAWWAPMAVAVIFGLAVATVLTLVLVPVMYTIAESASTAFRTRFPAGEDV